VVKEVENTSDSDTSAAVHESELEVFSAYRGTFSLENSFYNLPSLKVGVCRILNLPDIRSAGYPADLQAGYRISGSGQIPDIRPDIRHFENKLFGQQQVLKVLPVFRRY